MSINAAEWIMASASVATGLFVGWQSYTLNRTIETPFQAVLLERQIDLCAEVADAFGAVVGEARGVSISAELLGRDDFFQHRAAQLAQELQLAEDTRGGVLEEGNFASRLLGEARRLSGESLQVAFDVASREMQLFTDYNAAVASQTRLHSALSRLRVHVRQATRDEIDAMLSSLPLQTRFLSENNVADVAELSDLIQQQITEFERQYFVLEAKCSSAILNNDMEAL